MITEIKAKIGQWSVARSVAELTIQPTPVCCIDIETYGSDDLPGDVAASLYHGIAGVAICNLFGDAVYAVPERPGVAGIPMAALIQYLNENWLKPGTTVVVHHGKFDLGFLEHRGLDVSKVILRDTWLFTSIGNKGVFKSSKLKECVRERLGLETATEEAKDKFFEEHKTKDYGKLPLELIAPYACDDVRYALLLVLTGQPSVQEIESHDLYMRNCRELNAAEARGACVDINKMKLGVIGAEKAQLVAEEKIKQLLNGVEIDVHDEQKMLKHLHDMGLYSEPRPWFGETKYVFDHELLESMLDVHEIVGEYYWFHRRAQFLKHFSPRHGPIRYRVFQRDQDVGFHVGHHISVSKRGGMPLVKAPDLDHAVLLTNEVRSLFVARTGYELVTVSVHDLPLQVLLYYMQDKRFDANPAEIIKVISEQTRVKPAAVRCVLRGLYEGWGKKILALRLTGAGFRGLKASKAHFTWLDQVTAALPAYQETMGRMAQAIKSTGGLTDRMGRFLQIESTQEWRAFAILMQSTVGSIYSATLDVLCRIAKKNSAHLVLAHHNEFVFEIPKGSTQFIQSIHPGIEQHAGWTPQPKVNVHLGGWARFPETLSHETLESA